MINKGCAGVVDMTDFASGDHGGIYYFYSDGIRFHQQDISLSMRSHVQSYVRAKTPDYITGTVTGASTSKILTVTGGGLPSGQLVGDYVRMDGGTYDGDIRKIEANTATTITVAVPFDGAPANTDPFETIDLDTFDLTSVFENVYSTGTSSYEYRQVRYTHYFGSNLTSVVWTPTCEWGTINVALGSASDTPADAVGKSYGSSYTANTWSTDDANTIVLWYRWANTASPQYGEQTFQVQIDVTE
jgi:hypothetical protein